MPNDSHPTADLAKFVANLEFADIPEAVTARIEDLLLDWMGSTIAGWNTHPVPLFDSFARRMGPSSGPSQIFGGKRSTSPYFAALVNAAASHVIEQDDLHNGSVLHPGTVVFPAVVAAAQDKGISGAALLTAAVAGYEAGIRIGEFLGRSHYKIFHTTGTVGTLAAAVGVGKVLNLNAAQMLHTLGTAGTQAAGLWQFLSEGADSKQLHTAKAAADGLLSAYMASEGLTGAQRILDGTQGMAAGMSNDSDPARLTDRLGTRWATAEMSFKLHASCRHTHPAADALDELLRQERLRHEDISHIVTHVHGAAIDVLGKVTVPSTIHQAKFSMGTVLALLVIHGRAGVDEFERFALSDERVAALRDRIEMKLDPDIDRAYPDRWSGRVTVTTYDGRVLQGYIEAPRGDPGATPTRRELEDKFGRLARFSGAVSDEEAQQLLRSVWRVRHLSSVGALPC